MSDRPLLVLAEDDATLRDRLARALDQRGFEVRTAGSVAEARRVIDDETPEFVVLDLRMPDGSGLELIPDLIAADAATRVVVLTGYGSIATAVEAVRLGAVSYLTKPADADEIVAALTESDRGRPAPVPRVPMSLDQVEREHIHRVLLGCEGNVSEAARILGIHRRSLQRKLAKFSTAR